MVAKNQVYRCSVCGNIVEVLHVGGGELVCCGKPMELLTEKKEDVGMEKHVPIIEKLDGKIKVKVGSIPHPMEEKHFIEWIEILVDDRSYKKFLKPNDLPEAEFTVEGLVPSEVEGDNIVAREHCTIHGLWKS